MIEDTKIHEEGEKEEFKKGISDKDLLSQIQKWEDESDDLYSVLKSVWQQNLAYYRGFQTGSEYIHGKQSRSVENRIWMATETMIPIVSSRLPEVVVKGDDDAEASQMEAQELQEVLNYQFERVGTQEKSERWMRDMILKRYGVYKVGWDKKNDDVELKVIDPRRIRIPRYGKTVNELNFVIEYLEMSEKSLNDFFGKGTDKKITPSTSDSKELEGKARKENYAVTEVWTNEFVAWRSGGIILDKKPNPYFDFEDDDKNHFTLPQKPYIIKSLFETEESIIGDTDYVQQLIPVQDNLNIRKRQLENIINKVANPIMLIDSDVMTEEQAQAITNEEGLILYGRDAASGTKIRFEAPGQAPAYLFSDLESSRNEFDNIWGIHSTTRGERQGKETATGRQMLKQADLGRIDLLARQLERALGEIAEYWVQLIKMFYTEEKTFSIIGEDGIKFIKNFTGKKVGQVTPQVKAGSTLPRDEVSIHDEAILLWQNKAIGIKTFYKMLRLPNIPEAIDDYIKLNSGQLLQPQQGASSVVTPPTMPGVAGGQPTTPPNAA